jgi:lipopolysaccharide/colanic/teichoic acid biosynthesis glycosyltransferase
MVLPGIKYLFLPSVGILLIATLFSLKENLFRKEYIFEFLKTFNPLIFMGLFFCIGIFLSDQFYDKPFRDLLEYAVNFFFLFIFFALTYYSKNNEGFFWVFRRMSRVIWVTSIIVATIGLSKFTLQLLHIHIPIETPWGTSINDDKNFYALYSFLGLTGLFPRAQKKGGIADNVVLLGLASLLILNIVFSFSTRSVILLLLLLIVLIIVQLREIFHHNKSNTSLASNLRIPTIVFVIFAGFAIYQWNSHPEQKENWLVNYFGFDQSALNDDKIKINELAYQLKKWDFALQLFEDYSITEKIFGNGFGYLTDFGEKYRTGIDYPHNPVLSALLYSGILGAIFVLFFLFVSFYYSVLYFNKHPLFAMMLFVCTLFIFFSGNSIFSVPIFLFLFSLSFLVRHQEISELKLVPNLSKPGSKFIKETFDYLLATIAIVVLSPVLVIIVLFVSFTMGWPVVFTQVRIGQNGKSFKLHKFRSMKKVKSNTTVAAQEQNRITRFGKFMRKYKFDELPELWNIIRGDMSFVGPRPDVPGYADVLEGSDRIILQLKPGLTGAASLKYMHEEYLLAKQGNPKEYNDKVIFPDKVLVNKKYMQKWSLLLDLKIIALTANGKSMHEDKFL